MRTQICRTCGEVKALTVEYFHNQPNIKTGLNTECKRCANKRSAEYNRVTAIRRNQLKRDNRLRRKAEAAGKTVEDYVLWERLEQFRRKRNAKRRRSTSVRKLNPRYKFTLYRYGAQARGKPFMLTFDEFYSMWKKPCHYCGDEIKTIGVDRVDSSLGYILGNVVPCCTECNRMKNSKVLSDFIARCKRIAERHYE